MGVGENYYISIFQTRKKINGKYKKEYITSRSFYFDDVDEVHFKRFAKKFAFNQEYRNQCIDRSVRWARLSDWYDYNCFYYYEEFQTIQAVDTRDKAALRKMREQSKITYERCRQLYNLLDKKLEWLESIKEYTLHLKKEDCVPHIGPIKNDSNIEQAARLFNGISGIKTQFCCQGNDNGIMLEEWVYGKIWFPGNHGLHAFITFKTIPKDIASELNEFLLEKGVGICNHNLAISLNPENNYDFIKCMEEFAMYFSSNEVKNQ